jgi:ribonuclease HII
MCCEEDLAKRPGLDQERVLQNRGYRLIAGLDEAGRGAWAGPVYAGAVILPLQRPDLAVALNGVTDSKQLSPRRREILLQTIQGVALGVAVGAATAAEIDRWGILDATRLAMGRAIDALVPATEALIIDYVKLPGIPLPQRSLPKADRHCLTVAAASIVAKVSRDRWMIQLHEQYPGYGFDRHKGYGTAAHRAALVRLGPCPVHRLSWSPLRALKQNPSE